MLFLQTQKWKINLKKYHSVISTSTSGWGLGEFALFLEQQFSRFLKQQRGFRSTRLRTEGSKKT